MIWGVILALFVAWIMDQYAVAQGPDDNVDPPKRSRR